tara:strand:- start:37407 stop:38321 length:915 start_codon:yes stop_codon:yes gene_type:complete
MGFNYWAWVASHVALTNFPIKKACSFGRQVIHVHDFDREGTELSQLGLTDYLAPIGSDSLPYADERYFKDLGVNVLSIDYSDYEGADIIADLSKDPSENSEIKRLSGSFDAVFDIGTSEHVGNTFASISNAFALLRDGGYYFYDLPYSGWLNHGLIQFCPSYFAELSRTNELNMLFQFAHPTCREGLIVFARDNVNYFPNCITSLFGCIQKTGPLLKTLMPPVQTFCDISGPIDPSMLGELKGERNMPLLNKLAPDDFISYMNSSKVFDLCWSNWNNTQIMCQRNIFNPMQNDTPSSSISPTIF